MRPTAILAILAAGVLLAGLGFALSSGAPAVTSMKGSLFISDAGQSHGGFEYTASYNVTLNVNEGSGVLVTALNIGLGDVLTKHEYQVTQFRLTGDGITMELDGKQVSLPYTSNDVVWNHSYDGSYIASWGSTSPAEEIRGTISPSIFLGVPSTYYVELRLA